ncbi:MAG: tetratricopeptide repeat protein, partial [Bryobacteraceae bacterium]
LGLISAAEQIGGRGPDASVPDLFLSAEKLTHAGRYQEAYPIAVQAQKLAGQFSTNDARYASSLNQVGLLCHMLGRYAEAEQSYRRAIVIIEEDTGQQRLLTLALQNLCSLYMDHGARYSRAERLMRRALEVSAGLFESDSPEIGAMLANLGTAHMMQRHDSEARVFFNRALAILENSPELYQTNVACLLMNLGILTARRGDSAGALPLLLRAAALYEQRLGSSHPELLKPLMNLGQLYLVRKRWGMAQESFKRAAAIAETVRTEDPILSMVLSSYATALRRNGRKDEAREIEGRAKMLSVFQPGSTENMTVHVSDLMSNPRGKTPSEFAERETAK